MEPRETWRSWIGLRMVRGLGNVTYRELVTRFGSPQSVFCASRRELIEAGVRADVADGIGAFQDWDHVDQEVRGIEAAGGRLVTLTAEDYPENLRRTHDPPPFLYVRGKLVPEDRLAVAVVGSRRPSLYGCQVTRELAAGLARCGVTVVSGLARGIDGEAHRAALEAGGRTIAVLGSGLDIIYPSEHKIFVEAIEGSGAVVSEFSLGTPPEAANFPYRNRVISGLALGTVVVEAQEKSGSLITAALALDQGREVFAVPGNVGQSGSRGTNRLIKDGAKLVESIEDILSEIAPALRVQGSSPPELPPLSADETTICALLGHEEVHVDALISRSGLTTARVLEVLLELELNGIVVQQPGKVFALARAWRVRAQ